MLNLPGGWLGMLALALSAAQASAQTPAARVDQLIVEARTARERGNFADYLRRVRELASAMPGHPSMRFSLARALALNGRAAESVGELRRLASEGFAYDPAADPGFEALGGEPAFSEAVRALAANSAPRGARPTAIIRLGLSGLQPEGVAAVGSGDFLAGSLAGDIFRFGAAGGAPVRVAAAGAMVAGIRVERSGDSFLACVTNEGGGTALVHRYRTSDGALLAMYQLPASRPFCNDIALIGDSGFAVTDSNNGAVYRVAGGRLRAMPVGPLFYPNGIAADPEGGMLYVAHADGIVAADLATGIASPLAVTGTALGGIDGLAWHRDALIAVQNVTTPVRVLRITPRPDGTAEVETLLSGEPALAGATTVAVAEGDAFVLSQTGIPNGTPPDDPVLVRLPL